MPVLLIVADRDVVSVEHAVEMFRALRRAELAVVPGTDHMQLVERWPMEMIERFIRADVR